MYFIPQTAQHSVPEVSRDNAPDGWESARFQAFFLAWSGFRQSGVLSSRPPAGTPAKYAGAGREPLGGWSRNLMKKNIITIDFLADHLDTIPTLAKWFRDQWPDYY